MVRYEIFDARELLSFPEGDNSTDTVFGDVHFNVTTLDHFNYTYYSNGTLSNGSKCWLTFEPYEPVLLFRNGSFVNATACDSAIDPIAARGFTGIAFAVAYGFALVLTLTALSKHGRLYLPQERRFYPIGRRWQWYWGCFVCACALISLLFNVDIDRDYQQGLPIIVTVFFWFLMCQGTLALCWEAVRHWGSWLERQYIDPNPFVYRDDDRRSKVEFYLPLWFYFWLWMNFFLVVPRSWGFIDDQRSVDLTRMHTIPTATSPRFKVAAFCLAIGLLTTIFSVRHSVKYYKPSHRGILNSTMGFARSVPLRFILIIPLTGALIAYQAVISFVWYFSLMRQDGPVPIIYAWGYGPSVLILYIQILYAYFSPNEDKELIRQRRERGEVIDRELGLARKPAWWKRVRGDHIQGTMRDKILRNVHEVGGGPATGRRVLENQELFARDEALREARDDGGIELDSMQRGKNNPRADRAGAKSMAQARPAPLDTDVSTPSEVGLVSPPPPYASPGGDGRSRPNEWVGSSARANSTSTTNSAGAPAQQIRSMLDV